MTDIEYRVADLINFSSNQKPIEFEQAFRGILAAKVSDAIENKKVELAQTMFNRAEEESADVEEDEVEEAEAEEEAHAEVA